MRLAAPPPTPNASKDGSQGPLPGIASTDPDPQYAGLSCSLPYDTPDRACSPHQPAHLCSSPKQADPRPLGLYDFDVASSDIVLVVPAPSSQDPSLPPTLTLGALIPRAVPLSLSYPKARVSDSPLGVRDGRFVEWHA